MQKNIQLYVDAKLLATDEAALKNVVGLLSELEEKGFVKESRIVFDSTQENEISEIFNRHMDFSQFTNSESK